MISAAVGIGSSLFNIGKNIENAANARANQREEQERAYSQYNKKYNQNLTSNRKMAYDDAMQNQLSMARSGGARGGVANTAAAQQQGAQLMGRANMAAHDATQAQMRGFEDHRNVNASIGQSYNNEKNMSIGNIANTVTAMIPGVSALGGKLGGPFGDQGPGNNAELPQVTNAPVQQHQPGSLVAPPTGTGPSRELTPQVIAPQQPGGYGRYAPSQQVQDNSRMMGENMSGMNDEQRQRYANNMNQFINGLPGPRG